MTVRFLETQKGIASLWEEYIPAGELIKCCYYQNNWHNAVQTTISWFPASARRPGQQSLLPPFRPIVNQPLLRQMGELREALIREKKDFLWNDFVNGGGGLTDFIPLFYFSKHPSNTLQTPCNTLKTPLKHPSTPFKQPSKSSIFFAQKMDGKRKIYEVISQKIFFFHEWCLPIDMHENRFISIFYTLEPIWKLDLQCTPDSTTPETASYLTLFHTNRVHTHYHRKKGAQN